MLIFSDAARFRTRAVVLMEIGVSCREVSRQLNVNVKTVYGIKKRLGETGSVPDRATERKVKEDVGKTRPGTRPIQPQRSRELRQRMESELGVTVSSSTIRKRLNSAGLHSCVAVKKPLLRPANIKSRLVFARRHKNWTVQQWDTVVRRECFLAFLWVKVGYCAEEGW